MEKNRYGHILTENFQEAVGAWIKNYSNNIAIIEGERKITYRELGNLIIRCRKFFFEQGVKKGDNIAVHMGNHSEFIMVFLSLVTMGAVPILILSAQKKNEVRGIVRVATPKLYIYDAAVSVLGSLVAEGNKELKGIEKTIFTSMLESSEVEKTKEETYKEQIVPEDLALLLLSGGTTGIPKLIPRTHGDYLYNVKRITERLKLTQESVFLSVLPMAHNFALGNPGILGTLCSGGTVVICNDIAAMEIFSLIEETKVTFTAFVPSILKMCLEYRILDDGDDISSLQQVLVGGAMLPEETARQVDLVLGGKLIQVFGTAEGLICTRYLPVSFSFPLKRCFAVSLVIDKQMLSTSTRKMMAEIPINLDKIGETLGVEKKWYIEQPSSSLQHLFTEIYEAKGCRHVGYFKIKAIELLYYMEQLTQINSCDFKYFDKRQIEATKAIRDYLIGHLDEKISLECLAKEAHLNLTVFHNIFFHIYGDTPYAYLKKYKMNLAAKLLLDGKRKIGDIALELGYNNASKFTKAFQSVYGVLPKDYRKNK